MSLFFYSKASQRRQKNYYICNRLYQTRNRMTFEEFFTKKKIDLKALKAADEPLFEEFRAHYSAMGEKSFDHSKKFWFNKLRKSYHLAEEETVVIKKPIQTDPVEKAPAATDATTAKPAGFKPRFKATTPTTESAEQKEEPTTEPSTAAANSTAGFKPRFKPGITKNTATSAEETSAPTALSNDTAPETAKPTGFKPRFKPGVTKAADSTVNEDISPPAEASDSSATEATKPTGFKPRFKAGLTKAAEPLQPASSNFDEAGPANPSIEPQQENTAETDTTAANKPAGFKPRFKAGVTKTENTDSSQTKPATVENTVDKQQKEPSEQETAIAKPTGFTPRFKAGVTKAADATTPPAAADSTINEDTSSPAEALDSSATEASKPTGFKPRFKAGITKTASTDNKQAAESVQSANSSVEDATTPSAVEDSTVTANTSSPAESAISSATEISKPTGFKPRFKAGLTKTASTDSPSTVVPSAANTDDTQEVDPPTEDPNAKQTAAPEATPTGSNMANPTVEPQQNDDTTTEQTATSKPTGFKPRFKAGLTKIDKKEE